MKGRHFLPALLLMAAPLPALAEETAQPTLPALDAAAEALNQGDCTGVVAHLEPTLTTPDFAALAPRKRAAAYFMSAFCKAILHDAEGGLSHARLGLDADPDFAPLWNLAFGMELDLGLHEKALVTLEDMMAKAPAASAALDLKWIGMFNNRLAAAGSDDLRTRLLKVLTAPDFHPALGDFSLDWYRKQYATQLAAQGRMQEAAAQVDGIITPHVLRLISVDPQLWAMMPYSYDWARASERYVTALSRQLSLGKLRTGDRLRLTTLLATELTSIGNPQHAIDALVSAAPPRVTSEEEKAPVAEGENWWWDALARAYTQAGDYEQAVQAFREGILSGEAARDPVSQRINLAYLQDRFGHSKDALRTLAEMDEDNLRASPYGRMEYHLARGCAAFHLGKTKQASADLAYMRAHHADHPEALGDLLMCMDRIDDAAAEMILRLGDPERRADALLQLSDYDPLPEGLPPIVVADAIAKLRERSDVKAAIDSAGGIRKFPIQRPSL